MLNILTFLKTLGLILRAFFKNWIPIIIVVGIINMICIKSGNTRRIIFN